MHGSLLRVATRQSALALAQTKMAADAIVAATGIEYELVPMTTEGDRRLDKSLASFGGKGVFIPKFCLSSSLPQSFGARTRAMRLLPAGAWTAQSSWTCPRVPESVPEASAVWCS